MLLENTGSALTTYVDTTVTPQTSYVYRVKAINAHGVSERSSWANALTPAVPAPPPTLTPAQPTGLTADPAHDQVGLDWDDPDDPRSPATASCADCRPRTCRVSSPCCSRTPVPP